MGKIRQHFEPHFQIPPFLELNNQAPYSIVIADAKKMAKKQIHDIVDNYLKGTKTFVFVESEDIADSILYVLEGELNDKGVYAEKNNLRLKKDANNEFLVKSNAFRIFNFELYVVDNLSNFLEEAVVIYEGKCSLEERMVLEKLSQKTAFNIQQYFIEHASTAKNILVRAGAGTGKTYSMVSRIAFLCNKYENPTENLIDDIAMITFTNDAADNMKNRLKQMFINYFVLTSNPKFLKYIENMEKISNRCCMPYIIGTERGLEKRIILEESWKRFLIDNMVYIRGWIQMKKIKYLQDRNPGVPGIIYKLEPENEKHRKLQKIRGLWTAVIEMSDIYDIYSGSHIEQNEYEIDHFVPWSFVTNDEMWNLIPVNPSLNASKRDKLPNWDRYFLSFAQNQFRLNQMVYKYERLAHIFRECQRDNLNAAWSVEELYVKNIKNDQFCKVLESRLKPIYELARTQGYRIWMVGE